MSHLIHFGHYHLPRMGEMGKVFWTHSTGSFGAALISLFVPIYLLNIGYSLTEVLLFICALNGFSFLLQYPMAKFVAARGGNHGIAIAQIFAILYYAALLTLPALRWPLALVAVLWAVDRTLYWVSFHANFSKARAHQRSGTQIGLIISVVTVAHGLAPALGGVLATTLGIGWVYGLAILILAVSAAPMLTGLEVTRRRPLDLGRLDLRRLARDLASNVCNGITTGAEIFVWPLIVFLVISSYAGVGILSSVAAIVSIGIALYVGKREERHGERRYLHRGLALETITNLLRAVVQNAGHVFGINFINGVGRSLYVTPYMTRYYRHADEEPRLEYITSMEMANEGGQTVYFGLLAVLSLFLPAATLFIIAVILAAPASFGTRLIR